MSIVLLLVLSFVTAPNDTWSRGPTRTGASWNRPCRESACDEQGSPWTHGADPSGTPSASEPAPECRSAVECLAACEADQAMACRVLASMYELGVGVPRDLAKAESFFRRACDLGDERGCVKAKEYREQHDADEQRRKDADEYLRKWTEAERKRRECFADCQAERHECGQEVVRQHSSCLDSCRDDDDGCVGRCDMQFESGEDACRGALDRCRDRCD